MRPGFYRAMALAFCAAPLDSLDAQAQNGWSIFEVAPEASYAGYDTVRSMSSGGARR